MSRQIGLTKGNRVPVIIMALAMVAVFRLPLEAQSNIGGVVKNAAGEPVAGALVKVSGDGLGFMVVSQEQGRYITPKLLPGKYTVLGFGDSNQSGPAGPVEVRSGQQGKMDLILSVPLQIPQREKRMTDDDFEKLMPEAEQTGLKQIIVSDCKECHMLSWTVSARKSREQWKRAVESMYNDLLGRRMPLWFALKDDEFAGGKRKDNIIDYLATHFGPDTPLDGRVADQMAPFPGGPSHANRNLPGTLLKGAAAQYVAMEFSLPSGATPNDIAVDAQGVAWVSERNTGMLGRFDPNSLTYTRIAAPPGVNAKMQLNAVAVDQRDQIWFADDGANARILQYNPKSREFNSYPIPEYRWPVPEMGQGRIATLRFTDGTVWGTRIAAQRILRLETNTRKINEYSVPRGSDPFGLAVGASNMIWYAAEVGNVVVRFDPSTGRMTPYDVPTERSDLRGMAADAEGNLWVAGMESGKLVKVDGRTGKATEYAPPTENSGPYAVDVDTKRNLIWFSESYSDRIGRFDPKSNSFVEFPHPSSDAGVRRIEVDRSRPNRVWWAGAHADKIGYVDVNE